MTSVNPYLHFDGDCEAAFEFYRSVFGGDALQYSRYSDMPPDSEIPPEVANLVLHVGLPIGSGQVLMGSDRPPGTGSTTFGDSVSVTISAETAEEGRRIFEALAAGGEVVMPYEPQFWGDEMGMCTDRFGIHWMVDHGSVD